jgi:ADP-ribose pyrophosphatase YjhB (NUDIX family)
MAEPIPPSEFAPRWLRWAQRVGAIAQNGLTYTEGPFDRERYTELQRLAAEMLAALDADGAAPERVLEQLAREDGYMTPKVDVRGAVFRGDELLLVKEREDGRWTLPGGWADVGESAAEAVVKEIREESGYETRAVKLLAAWDRERHPHPPLAWYSYKMVFHCELVGGAPAESIETSDVGFFREDEIPPLSLTRILPQQIARIFAHRRHPEWATEFD